MMGAGPGADVLKVPDPGFEVDGLTNRTEEAKGGEVGILVSRAHHLMDIRMAVGAVEKIVTPSFR